MHQTPTPAPAPAPRPARAPAAALALIAALALLGVACGNDSDTIVAGDGRAGGDAPGSAPGTDPAQQVDPAPTTVPAGVSEPTDTTAPIPTGAQPVTPEPGVGLDVRARPFDRAVVRPDGTAVDVYFYGGVPECYVLDRVDANQADPGRISLTVYQGARPGAQVCIEIAVSYVTTVALATPVPAATPVIDATDGVVKS